MSLSVTYLERKQVTCFRILNCKGEVQNSLSDFLMYLLAFKNEFRWGGSYFQWKNMVKIYFMVLNQGKWAYLRITTSQPCAV